MSQLHLQSLFTVNEVEIIYRNKTPYQDRIPITSSATAYEILRQAWDENRMDLIEQFKILLLDCKNNCLGVSDITDGGTGACLADPRVIFVTALIANAASIILAHNYRSGDLQFSKADKALTRKLREAAYSLILLCSITSSSHPAATARLPMRG
jgi:DNA repair protein RadC